MAEQFDMDIYKAALEKGYYEPPKDNAGVSKSPNLVFLGDSVSLKKNPNLTRLTEDYRPHDIESRRFSEDGEK